VNQLNKKINQSLFLRFTGKKSRTKMKTKCLLSLAICCFATFQLAATVPLDKQQKVKKADILPKDSSVIEHLPEKEVKEDEAFLDDKKDKVKVITFFMENTRISNHFLRVSLISWRLND